MTQNTNDPVLLAIEDMLPLFEQCHDIPAFLEKMRGFASHHLGAFRLAANDSHEKLTQKADGLLCLIRKDFQNPCDLESYYQLLSEFLRQIPLSPASYFMVGFELMGSKFESVDACLRRSTLQAFADNVTRHKMLEVLNLEKSVSKRSPEVAAFDTLKDERGLAEVIHWLADHDDPLAFEVFGSQVLPYIMSIRNSSPEFDPISLVVHGCVDHENRRLRCNERNNAQTPQSPLVGWMVRNQNAVADAIMAGTWSIKHHPKHIATLRKTVPELEPIAQAMTLRSYDQDAGFLLDLRGRGVMPDLECINILKGKYNQLPWAPTEIALVALMAYTLVHDDVLGNEWVSPPGGCTVKLLAEAVGVAKGKKLGIQEPALQMLAKNTLDRLRRGDEIDWIFNSEDLKPYLKGNRNLQGLRLEHDLGM
jgi:hypothetical protein